MTKVRLFTGLLAAALLLASCSTVPGTGRSQFIIFSQGYLTQLGEETYGQMLADAPIVTSGADYEMVQRVGRRIANAANRLYPDPSTSFDWEFRLVDEPKTVNAWALPGGKSAVYTGLLSVTQTEDALAVVMGHEAAHALANHGGERMSQSAILSGALAGTSLIDMDAKTQQVVMLSLGVGGNLGMLAYGRSHESEADELGIYIAADAGYDPRESIGLWQRMAEASGGGGPPEFLSTHPSEETRIERLQEAMPKAMDYYRASGQRRDNKRRQ